MPTDYTKVQTKSDELAESSTWAKAKYLQWKDGPNVLRILPGFDTRYLEQSPDFNSPAPEGARWADYVLKRYDADQRRILPEMLERAGEACLVWIREGIDTAMNRFNPA